MRVFSEKANTADHQKSKHMFFQSIIERKAKKLAQQKRHTFAEEQEQFVPYMAERDNQGGLIKSEPKQVGSVEHIKI